ncbi:family 78 glycoside hydrolase catalytic domain [Planctomonas psychrotolerans]|uniref:family 78 glycoside hydrolase catalytic domain n=1 Tax=Planctomonas psychrotolerans TaxID=2528712 RepID=UPI001238BFCA|nr:family 78 glycoside hydrolase catalytic domain [Planctomonas psychrotolerans]
MITTILTAERPSGDDFVPTATPPLSWTTETDTPDWLQASAEVQRDGGEPVTLDGAESVLVDWPFAPLAPRERASVRVRVTGADGGVGDWSAPLEVRGGFLPADGWHAAPIGLASPEVYAQPALLRSEFTIDGPVASATLYATALGSYQAALNGSDVDDQVLKPGWTVYQYRTVHETTDVTALLTQGTNALAIRLAGAWATEVYGFRGHQRTFYAEQPTVAAQLVIEYADGRVAEVVTGDGWRAAPGPVTASGIYQGEHYDARLEQAGFDRAGFDDSGWAAAAVAETAVVPEPRRSPAVRRIEELAVQEVIRTPAGATVLDFGQNLVGWLRIRVRGEAGSTVTLRHAEVLEHGELGTRPLRRAAATDSYTLAGAEGAGAEGAGPEVWEPEFTFHGFRYAEIDGWPGELDPADITAVVVHSDMERTGWFDSSHELVNRLHENVVWGLRGNFLSLPTDCPQRDERLGWTGDIQVFAPTSAFLYDTRGFLASWLRDLWLDQKNSDGVVPFTVPNVLGPARPAAAWGDAAAVVPWVLHERFADRAVLTEQFDSMRAWVDLLVRLAGDNSLWEGDFQFGDWLDPTAPPEHPAEAATHADIVATAYLFRSADLTARIAALLGRTEEETTYRDIAETVRAAFLAEYVTPAGRMMSDAQTGYAMAIMFDIAPTEQHEALGRRLADLVREHGYRIRTGFVGTPIIQDALTRTGHLDTATRLLLQTENPSWLYPVTMGATTVWERWDSMLPDGTINPGQMTSFNHYALGAIADWLHRVVAGLAPAEPGYRVIRIAPTPIAGFDSASAEHRTPYGPARVAWRRDGSRIVVSATVPPNSSAEVSLPDGTELTVGSGEHAFTVDAPRADETYAPLGLDSSLAQVIDDPAAYAIVIESLTEAAPAIVKDVRAHTVWLPGRSVGEMLGRHASGTARDLIETRFERLNAERAADAAA